MDSASYTRPMRTLHVREDHRCHPLPAFTTCNVLWHRLSHIDAHQADCHATYRKPRPCLVPGWTKTIFEVHVLQYYSFSIVFVLSHCFHHPHAMCSSFIDCLVCVCRVEDYWVGYKLFCYAYYSHSVSHESEFRLSKLGWCFLHFHVSHAPFFFLFLLFKFFFGWHAHPSLYARDGWSLRLLNYFRAHRAACLAPACGFPLSFPPCYPHHMHTAPPSCGDVLQIRIARRL